MTASPPRSSSAPRVPVSAGGKPSVDLRTLSLAQLHQATQRGSRRARAELERRLSLSEPQAARPVVEPLRSPSRDAAAPAIPATRPRPPRTGAAQPSAEVPRAAPAQPRRETEAPDRHQALLEQWALIERQALERSRLDGAPQLIGLLLLAWGALIAFGALVLLAYGQGVGGGLYYLLCGVGVAAVGGLLMRNSRWALLLHPGLLLVALAMAWGQGGVVSALVQASPLLVPALWVFMSSVREALD